METAIFVGVIALMALLGVLLSLRVRGPLVVRIPENLRNRGFRIAGEVSTGKTVLGALRELGRGAKSAKVAQFLSLYIENPNVTLIAKSMGLF